MEKKFEELQSKNFAKKNKKRLILFYFHFGEDSKNEVRDELCTARKHNFQSQLKQKKKLVEILSHYSQPTESTDAMIHKILMNRGGEGRGEGTSWRESELVMFRKNPVQQVYFRD